MKRIISSLGVALALFSFAFTTKAQTLPFEYSTAASPKWYSIKNCMKTADGNDGYATNAVFEANGMERNVNFAAYTGTPHQQFRFEQIAGQDSFKIICRAFPDGCLLSKGGLRSQDKIYGKDSVGFVAWATRDLGGGQYLILAEDGQLDKGEDGTGNPTPQRLHAQATGSVIVSWPEGETNSASAWTFEPVSHELGETQIKGYILLFNKLEKYDTDITPEDMGYGVGQYPEPALKVLWALLDEMKGVNIELATYDEFLQYCIDIKEAINVLEDQKGVHTPILPQVSTAENPIWYLWQSDAKVSDGRRDRFLTMHSDSAIYSDPAFESNNFNQFWRFEKRTNEKNEDKYALILRSGGCLARTVKGGKFVIEPDTMCFNFTIRHQDIKNKEISAKTVVVINDADGQAVHLQNYDPFATMVYGPGDNGSRMKFTLASEIASDSIHFSTDTNEVWYYIKNKRQADKATGAKAYLTAYSAEKDSIHVRGTGETAKKFNYQVFGSLATQVQASGDSAKWKFVKATIDEFDIANPTQTISVTKTLIINKMTGKALNAYDFGKSMTIRFTDPAVKNDTIYPYWDLVDKTKNRWILKSNRVFEKDGNLQTATTYANFDNGPGLVLYDNGSDEGSDFWLERVTEVSNPESTPESSDSSIKIVVVDGKVVVNGTDAKPSVFTITGASIDANKKLAPGVYIVKAGNKVDKVVVQ